MYTKKGKTWAAGMPRGFFVSFVSAQTFSFFSAQP
jgi:hypothetical protein